MNFWQRPTGFIFVILMVFMALQVVMKKPYCIDSSIVHKIDIVKQTSNGLVEGTLHSCRSLQKPNGNVLAFKEIELLSARLGRLEALMSRLAINNSFKLKIESENKPNMQWKDSTLLLSFQDLKSENTLETELIKKVLLQSYSHHQLAATLADILVQNKKSLEPYAQVWFETEKSLGGLSRLKLQSLLRSQIRNRVIKPSESVETVLSKILENSSNKSIVAQFQRNLVLHGLKWTDEPFDLVIQTKEVNELVRNQLKELSKAQPKVRIGVIDATGFYTLPHLTRVNSQNSLRHRAHLRLVLADESLRFNELAQFSHNTDQLLMVKIDEKNTNKINFKPLFESHLNAFLRRNKDLNYIQMHMASFQFRSQFFKGEVDLFSWLKKLGDDPEKKAALGWQSHFWSLELQAYKPVAVYDVIQSFRIN